jgi:hypothetical protein
MLVESTPLYVQSAHSTVQYGNNATQSFDSTSMRVIVFLNGRSYVPAAKVYVYIVIKLFNTHRVKTTIVRVVKPLVSRMD